MNQICKLKSSSRQRIISPIPIKTWSPTRLSLMLYMEPDQLQGNDDQEFLKLLFEKCPEIKQMGQLVKDFKKLFQCKEDGLLKAWIEEAGKSECGLKNFAKNLSKDFDAVNNSVITPFSNGQVEGQVNRIKNIKKKSMAGPAFNC